MFVSHHLYNIDDKGRVTIPARFRDSLEDGAYLTKGFDGNLTIIPAAQFNHMYNNVNELSLTDPVARRFKRYFFANASKIEFDKLSRILIPQYLRDAAHLKGEAVVTGVGDNIEIWAPELWAIEESNMESPEAIDEYKNLNLSLR
jgi:MraZ protein